MSPLADAEQAAQRSHMRYDRDGDSHYDILSALQKSIRGSDPDAALHYLARLLECRGHDLRRAAHAGHREARMWGWPIRSAWPSLRRCGQRVPAWTAGGAVPLAEAAVLMATAPKSNSALMGMEAALADVRAGRTDIPRISGDAHYGGAAKLGARTDLPVSATSRTIGPRSNICRTS